ncbi:hypothetical protein L1987_38260 [Smallanthus sonchifolius]|uniref:Uncharacterized protein n=1 Tax=Smallanthus sonchifolius TaxID=185202 RepID=A0ACB9HIP7_9ASTR|nr:hypothetical protein L1987_38260 [Smallanthus sonchifolius]
MGVLKIMMGVDFVVPYANPLVHLQQEEESEAEEDGRLGKRRLRPRPGPTPMIMGDVEDPSMGLNKILQSTAAGVTEAPSDFEFNDRLGVVDQGFTSLDSGTRLAKSQGGRSGE